MSQIIKKNKTRLLYYRHDMNISGRNRVNWDEGVGMFELMRHNRKSHSWVSSTYSCMEMSHRAYTIRASGTYVAYSTGAWLDAPHLTLTSVHATVHPGASHSTSHLYITSMSTSHPHITSISTSHPLYHIHINITSLYHIHINITSLYHIHINITSLYHIHINITSLYHIHINITSLYHIYINIASLYHIHINITSIISHPYQHHILISHPYQHHILISHPSLPVSYRINLKIVQFHNSCQPYSHLFLTTNSASQASGPRLRLADSCNLALVFSYIVLPQAIAALLTLEGASHLSLMTIFDHRNLICFDFLGCQLQSKGCRTDSYFTGNTTRLSSVEC